MQERALHRDTDTSVPSPSCPWGTMPAATRLDRLPSHPARRGGRHEVMRVPPVCRCSPRDLQLTLREARCPPVSGLVGDGSEPMTDHLQSARGRSICYRTIPSSSYLDATVYQGRLQSPTTLTPTTAELGHLPFLQTAPTLESSAQLLGRSASDLPIPRSLLTGHSVTTAHPETRRYETDRTSHHRPRASDTSRQGHVWIHREWCDDASE